MDIQITNVIAYVMANINHIADLAAWLIAGSSVIVFFMPWLPDNHVFKGIMRVLGKIALNRSTPK